MNIVRFNETVDCWQMTTDGQTWTDLLADNPDASYEAIEEASEKTDVPTNQWDIEGEEWDK